MPQSLLADPFVKAMAMAMDPELQAVSNEILFCLILPRIDYLTENVIDHFAWQFHVDFYEPDLSLDQKRTLVKGAIAWHRHKGTPWAIEQVVSVIFPKAKVLEWFQYYDGKPYHFRVQVDSYEPCKIVRLFRAIDVAKNKRSWLENVIIVDLDLECVLYATLKDSQIHIELALETTTGLWPYHCSMGHRQSKITNVKTIPITGLCRFPQVGVSVGILNFSTLGCKVEQVAGLSLFPALDLVCGKTPKESSDGTKKEVMLKTGTKAITGGSNYPITGVSVGQCENSILKSIVELEVGIATYFCCGPYHSGEEVA
jgi:phage tail P2-like protein